MIKPDKIFVLLGWVVIFSMALGAAWTTKRLTNNASGSYKAAIAVNGGNVYVVWYDYATGTAEIFFRKSSDNGVTWQLKKRLSNNAGYSSCPTIAVSGTNVYVTWEDDSPGNEEIYLRRSTDSGATWQAAKRLTNNSGFSGSPAIAADGANVYVVWSDNTPGNEEIFFRKSADYGATWSASSCISNNSGSSGCVDIAVYSNKIYVVWKDETSGHRQILFRKSTDGGATWNLVKQLTNVSGSAYTENPSIALDGTSIYVAWVDNHTDYYDHALYVRRSIDSGASWQASKRVTDDSRQPFMQDMAVCDSKICLVWLEDAPGNWEVYFCKSIDSGANWQSIQRLTNNSGMSWEPSIAVNTNKVFVTWRDNTPGNTEIYLKFSPL